MRARPVTAFALTRYAHAQPVPRSPAGDPHLAWAHENGLVGRERINRSDEAGDFTGLTRPTRNLFRTARAYREWARELSETDATWEAFERMRQARWNARHRALHAGQRDHNVEGAGRLLPCETTALDSSRVQPARRDSLPLSKVSVRLAALALLLVHGHWAACALHVRVCAPEECGEALPLIRRAAAGLTCGPP